MIRQDKVKIELKKRFKSARWQDKDKKVKK